MQEVTPALLAALVREHTDCTMRDAVQAVNMLLAQVRESAQPPAGLRDEFAMRIVPELVAAGINTPEAGRMPLAEFDRRIATRAYAIADAMLEARKPKV